jgi:hypothetical protein
MGLTSPQGYGALSSIVQCKDGFSPPTVRKDGLPAPMSLNNS